MSTDIGGILTSAGFATIIIAGFKFFTDRQAAATAERGGRARDRHRRCDTHHLPGRAGAEEGRCCGIVPCGTSST